MDNIAYWTPLIIMQLIQYNTVSNILFITCNTLLISNIILLQYLTHASLLLSTLLHILTLGAAWLSKQLVPPWTLDDLAT